MTPRVEDLLRQLSQVPVEIEPVASQRTIANWLTSNGFAVRWEVPVSNRGDGRGGRVDLVGYRSDVNLAVEIDRVAPKPKSIIKLRQIPDAVRVVVLRAVNGPWTGSVPDGIDAIITVALSDSYRTNAYVETHHAEQ